MSHRLIRAAALAALFTCTAGAGVSLAGDDGWMSDGNAAYVLFGIGSGVFVHDPVDARMAALRAGSGYAPSTPEPGTAINLSAEFGVFMVRAVSLGVRYEHHSRSYRSHVSSIIFSNSVTSFKTRADEGLLDLRVWLPPRRGAMVGLAGGISRGRLQQGKEAGYEWSGNTPVYVAYVGVQGVKGEGNAALMTARFGYAQRDFGTVAEGIAGDPAQSAELDMSGWFFELSFGGIAKIRSDK